MLSKRDHLILQKYYIFNRIKRILTMMNDRIIEVSDLVIVRDSKKRTRLLEN
jgi:hypothetical protein